MDTFFIKIAVAVLLMVAAIALAQKRRLREIFGFEPTKLWSYRDLVLGTLASIATIWAIGAFVGGSSYFDRNLGLASIVVVAVCCALSPNWHLILAAAVGFTAFQGWIGFAFTRHPRVLWIALLATTLEVVLVIIFRKHPIRRSWKQRPTGKVN